MAVVAAAWGFAMGRYELFPYRQLRPTLVEVRAFVRGAEGENKTLLQKLVLHRQERPREDRFAFPDVMGFRRVDDEFVDSGYLLVSRFSKEAGQVVIELVRLRDFTTLHHWIPPLDTILDHGPRDHSNNSRAGYRAQHPLLLEGGSVVFTSGQGPLVRIDRDSRLEWIIPGYFHHAIETDVDGNLVVPYVVAPPADQQPVPYVDDGFAVVSTGGRILRTRSVTDLLLSAGHRTLLFGIGGFEEDRIHLNDAHPVNEPRGQARVGDVMLSIRNLSTVMLYRPSTDSLVWIRTGPWLNQHDVNLLPGGDYSVFGNDMLRVRHEFRAVRQISDIYIYDPVTDAVSTPYTEVMRRLNAVTETAGRSRILANGDAFIEIHDAAQLLRITPDGVRWVFVNGLSNEDVGLVHWARYYEPREIDLSWLDGGNETVVLR